jgi:hypothetical protein
MPIEAEVKSSTYLLYDCACGTGGMLTTASFHVDYEDNDSDPNTTLRKFGHAKEGNWAPQVVVALAVTRWHTGTELVLPGNTADVTTVTKVRADLRGRIDGRRKKPRSRRGFRG